MAKFGNISQSPHPCQSWELWEVENLDQKLGTIGFLKMKIFGFKKLQIDSVILNLAIVHVRVLIHPKKKSIYQHKF